MCKILVDPLFFSYFQTFFLSYPKQGCLSLLICVKDYLCLLNFRTLSQRNCFVISPCNIKNIKINKNPSVAQKRKRKCSLPSVQSAGHFTNCAFNLQHSLTKYISIHVYKQFKKKKKQPQKTQLIKVHTVHITDPRIRTQASLGSQSPGSFDCCQITKCQSHLERNSEWQELLYQ